MTPSLSTPADHAPPAVEESPALDAGALFRAHFEPVYGFVARTLGPGAPEADVEDLCQQVFLVAHRRLHRFRGESQPRTWLFGIAYRVVLTHLRSRRRHRALVEALDREAGPAPAAPLEHRVHQSQVLARLWRALLAIPPKKRIAYVLHDVAGLPGATIAEIVGAPEATVWTRLHHARRSLRERLQAEGLEV